MQSIIVIINRYKSPPPTTFYRPNRPNRRYYGNSQKIVFLFQKKKASPRIRWSYLKNWPLYSCFNISQLADKKWLRSGLTAMTRKSIYFYKYTLTTRKKNLLPTTITADFRQFPFFAVFRRWSEKVIFLLQKNKSCIQNLVVLAQKLAALQLF